MFKLLLAFAFLVFSLPSRAQTPQQIKMRDSISIDRYFDSINVSPLYSQKRQNYFDSVLILTPKDAYLWQQKAMPLFKQKKYEIGLPFLDSAVKYDNTKHYMEYRGFMKCIFQKDYAGAIADFKEVEKTNENGLEMDHSYNFYIGLSFLQLNKFDSAFYYLNKSNDYREKKWGDGHYLEYMYLGIVKMEMEDYESAITNFDRALKIFPNFSDVKFYKAQCLMHIKRFAEATDLLNASLKDLKNGFTINEDNAVYEDYPYQLRIRNVEMFIKYYTSEENK